jgi:hypothetical protein
MVPHNVLVLENLTIARRALGMGAEAIPVQLPHHISSCRPSIHLLLNECAGENQWRRHSPFYRRRALRLWLHQDIALGFFDEEGQAPLETAVAS